MLRNQKYEIVDYVTKIKNSFFDFVTETKSHQRKEKYPCKWLYSSGVLVHPLAVPALPDR